MKKVGVLSLQGDFAAHGAALERAGAVPVFVREREQLGQIDGLIIPGGESTTMLKLLRYENLFDDLAEFGRRKPVFGTCAGAILMAKDVTNPAQESLGLMDIAIERNAYGRQIDSRVVQTRARIRISKSGPRPANWRPCSFAPRSSAVSMRACGSSPSYEGDPVLIEQGQIPGGHVPS